LFSGAKIVNGKFPDQRIRNELSSFLFPKKQREEIKGRQGERNKEKTSNQMVM
jgi:hypothetical protein